MGRYDIYLDDAPPRTGKDPFRARGSDGPLACFCNNVSIRRVQAAIDAGARTLGDLFDATEAGCGPCGGTCQPRLVQLLRAGPKPAPAATAPAKDEDPAREDR